MQNLKKNIFYYHIQVKQFKTEFNIDMTAIDTQGICKHQTTIKSLI